MWDITHSSITEFMNCQGNIQYDTQMSIWLSPIGSWLEKLHTRLTMCSLTRFCCSRRRACVLLVPRPRWLSSTIKWSLIIITIHATKFFYCRELPQFSDLRHTANNGSARSGLLRMRNWMSLVEAAFCVQSYIFCSSPCHNALDRSIMI